MEQLFGLSSNFVSDGAIIWSVEQLCERWSKNLVWRATSGVMEQLFGLSSNFRSDGATI